MMKIAFVFLSIGAAIAATVPEQSLSFPKQLFFEVAEEAPAKNVVISPMSIYTCLGLAYLGAEGDTEKDFKTAFQFDNSVTKEQAAENFVNLLTKIHMPRRDVDFKIANRIFVNQEYELAAQFNTLATKYFDASAMKVNFADKSVTLNTINSWVEAQTNNKIKNIASADSFDSSTYNILVNAIYFKANWEKHFVATNTKKQDFFASAGNKLTVDMMNQESHLQYADWSDLDATAIQLPYAHTDMYMMIVLPKTIDGLAALETKLKAGSVPKEGFSEHLVNVSLPKFKFDFDINLVDILKKMGLQSMFNADANFSGLLSNSEHAPFSGVIHKAFIDVNELGTEATAATLIEQSRMGRFYLENEVVQEFKVDHPFIFVIKDRETIYFAGHVVNIQ